jgi:hypothetical protein
LIPIRPEPPIPLIPEPVKPAPASFDDWFLAVIDIANFLHVDDLPEPEEQR